MLGVASPPTEMLLHAAGVALMRRLMTVRRRWSRLEDRLEEEEEDGQKDADSGRRWQGGLKERREEREDRLVPPAEWRGREWALLGAAVGCILVRNVLVILAARWG